MEKRKRDGDSNGTKGEKTASWPAWGAILLFIALYIGYGKYVKQKDLSE